MVVSFKRSGVLSSIMYIRQFCLLAKELFDVDCDEET